MGYFPEDCDASGTECLGCVRRTAEAVRGLTADPTVEWAAAAFQRMYSHPACRMLEHAFVQACGARMAAPAGPRLVTISAAA